METSGTIVVLSPSTDLYGSDRSLLASIPEMVKRSPVVIGVPSDGPLVPEAEALGARVVVLGDFALRRRNLAPRAVPGWLLGVALAMRTLRREVVGSVSLVYVNTLAVAPLPVLRRLFDAPVVLHVRERSTGSAWEQKILNGLARATADVVVANSEFTATTLQGVDRSKVEVVHNGIPVPDGEPTVRRVRSGPLKITCVGRLHPKKGQWVLLRAVEAAVAAGADWEVHLFGDALDEHASLEADLRRQAASPVLTGRVHFHGYVSDTDAFYRDMDVSVIPSVLPEEFSRVCAESQIRGLPVVVTGPGGITEVMVHGETGLAVAADDAAGLASAIEQLDVDPERALVMGRRGRERMLERFTEAHYRTGIRRVLERVETSS